MLTEEQVANKPVATGGIKSDYKAIYLKGTREETGKLMEQDSV